MSPDRIATWYKDALIYEVHIRSFNDANGDGIGDFIGLTKKLDYIADLGVTAIWLLPFYPSPGRDDGYDIADYLSINPEYGTMQDFKRFLRQAHLRGLKVITELVLNHTSDQHAWFQRARRAPKGSSHRDYYVWSDTPDKYTQARIIFQDTETSNWSWDPVAKAYYWHRFFSHQPDLNFEHPAVKKEMFKVVDFWLGLGVDGLRLDAVPYLYEAEGTNCENLPKTFAFLQALRAHVDRRFPNRMLLAEANQWPEDAARYFRPDEAGEACHMAFHFPVMPRLYMALRMEDRFPVMDILEQTPAIPESSQWAMFLRNHDELTLEMVTDEERDSMYRSFAPNPRARINLGIRRRLAPLVGNERRVIELLHILLFTLPGTPVLYYGDEIRMGDNIYLGDRNGVRTPMQWSADRNAGFSKANPQQLYLPVIIDPEYHYEAVNVENQESNPASFLWWVRRAIAIRKRHDSFSRGTLRFVPHANPHVLAYIRSYGDESILVVVNLSRFAQAVRLDLREYKRCTPLELFSGNPFPSIGQSGEELYTLTLTPHGALLLQLEHSTAERMRAQVEPPLASLAIRPGGFLDRAAKDVLEERVLPDYLKRRGIITSRHRDLRRLELLEALPMGERDQPVWLLILRWDPPTGPSVFLHLLVSAHFGQDAQRQLEEHAPLTLCRFLSEPGQEMGMLREGWPDHTPAQTFLRHFAQSRSIQASRGTVEIQRLHQGPHKEGALQALGGRAVATYESLPQHMARVEMGDLHLKIYGRTEAGPRPGAEMLQALQGRGPLVPELHGLLTYRAIPGRPVLMAALYRQPHAEACLTDMCRNQLQAVLEALLSDRASLAQPPAPRRYAAIFTNPEPTPPPAWVPGFVHDLFLRLGEYMACLHTTLAEPVLGRGFVPEPFSVLYQRSVFQSIQSSVKNACASLDWHGPQQAEEVAALAATLAGRRNEAIRHLKQLTNLQLDCLKIRIHGDCRLEMLRFTGKELFLADLDGDEARSLSERAIKRNCLRDMADLERSLWRISHELLTSLRTIRPEDATLLTPWVDAWTRQLFGTCLQAYLQTLDQPARRHHGGADLLPSRAAEAAFLFQTFLMDRRFREIAIAMEGGPGTSCVAALLASSLAMLDEAAQHTPT
ncbi:maltose alpha-D-glucosyltransferase [Megalodesulfovibrio gigas]|nr:maltose alpha-D-glucosyltransferase [Megalodesulfovibrio gigas]